MHVPYPAFAAMGASGGFCTCVDETEGRSPAGQASPCPRKPQKIGDFRHLHARNHAHAPVHGLQSNARAFRQWLGGGGVFGCAKGATPVAGRWAGRCCSHELYDLCGACGRKQIAVGPSVLLWCPVRG